MTDNTRREAASDQAAIGATHAPAMTRNGDMPFADRAPTQVIARLRKRAECRIEKDLDAFWDNVPI